MTTTHPLTERYGAPAPWRRRAVVVAVAAVVLAFAGWVTWTVWEQSRPEVASEMLDFTVVDQNNVTARVQLEFRDDTVQATCTLKAYATDHTLVGELDFTPDARAAGDLYTETIHTDRAATSVESVGCVAPGQGRPR